MFKCWSETVLTRLLVPTETVFKCWSETVLTRLLIPQNLQIKIITHPKAQRFVSNICKQPCKVRAPSKHNHFPLRYGTKKPLDHQATSSTNLAIFKTSDSTHLNYLRPHRENVNQNSTLTTSTIPTDTKLEFR